MKTPNMPKQKKLNLISKSKFMTLFTMVIFSVSFFNVATAQVLSGTGSYSGAPGFDRGFQATLYCGNNPESWIRGSAFLDKQTGLLTMHINLETDAMHAGPRGQVLVYIFDSNGTLIARVASDDVGRGGKKPGVFEQNTFQSSKYLGTAIGNQAHKIVVVPTLLGFVDRWWNIRLETVGDAFGLIQQFALFFF
jgi:hypothetical protein